jgi:hypothetical protein
MYSQLNITICENSGEAGGYEVVYNYDAMPNHDSHGPFPDVDSAKASIAYPVSWQEPDEDAGGDVIAVASVPA